MMKLTSPIAMTLLVLGSLPGCSLAPKADPSQFFVLNSASGVEALAGADGTSIIVGLGPVLMPEYLRRPQIVTRLDPNQVTYAEYDRWAQPLDESFVRVLSDNLSGYLGGVDVVLYPWFSTTQLNFIVEVTVQHFEQDTTGAARLVCVWTIKDGASGERIGGGQFERSEPSESATAGASVAAQSRLLSQLGREIAGAILGARR